LTLDKSEFINTALDLLLTHDQKRIGVEILEASCKYAFIGVVCRQEGYISKQLLDTNLLRLIFEFAGRPIMRRITLI